MGTTVTNNLNIPWWYTELGGPEIKEISKAINNKNISQGLITEKFEKVGRNFKCTFCSLYYQWDGGINASIYCIRN